MRKTKGMEAEKTITNIIMHIVCIVSAAVASDKSHISLLFVAIQDCWFPQYTYSSKIRLIHYIATHMHAQNITLKQ